MLVRSYQLTQSYTWLTHTVIHMIKMIKKNISHIIFTLYKCIIPHLLIIESWVEIECGKCFGALKLWAVWRRSICGKVILGLGALLTRHLQFTYRQGTESILIRHATHLSTVYLRGTGCTSFVITGVPIWRPSQESQLRVVALTHKYETMRVKCRMSYSTITIQSSKLRT